MCRIQHIRWITVDTLSDKLQPLKIKSGDWVDPSLLEYYRKANGATKKKILSSIFCGKLVLEKGKEADPVFTEPIQLIIRICDSIRCIGGKKKNEIEIER